MYLPIQSTDTDISTTKIMIWLQMHWIGRHDLFSSMLVTTNNNKLKVPYYEKMVKQAFQSQLLSLRNERGDVHWPASSAQWLEISERGRPSPRWSSVCPVVSYQCFAMSLLGARYADCSVVGCNICAYILSHRKTEVTVVVFHFNDNVPSTLPYLQLLTLWSAMQWRLKQV